MTTSNPIELLPGTSIAATSWELDDKVQLRVYTQDIEGNIRESIYSTGNGWSGGTLDNVVVKARPNSSMAVISRYSDNFGTFVSSSTQLYYISPDNILRELCTDTVKNTWSPGDLDALNVEVSPVSRLAAIKSSAWNSADTSIFYQRPDGAIGNIYYNSPLGVPADYPVGWSNKGIVGRKPLFGTGLAAVPFFTGENETSYNRVFYQLPSGQLAATDIDWVGKFSDGDLPTINDAAAATNISAWAPDNEPISFRLSFLDKRNNAIELVYSDNQYSGPKPAGKFLPVPASDISTIQVKDANNLRLYVQDDNNVIQEYIWATGQADWKKGSLIPTGKVQS